MDQKERAAGCLIGGAYGDSLGAPVEFFSSDQIKKAYGPYGIGRLQEAFGRVGNITDDTQMAIATAEGLVDTPVGLANNRQIVANRIWLAYQRWYKSQAFPDNCRYPGETCTTSLEAGQPGSVDSPLNGSAGCGGIMRVHPVGLAYADRHQAYQTGVDSAALTHGHPDGYVPAGFMSVLISDLAGGQDFDRALKTAVDYVQPQAGSDGTIAAIERAANAQTDSDPFETIDNQVGGGGGWLGHDALAIAVYAVRRAASDPIESVCLAVNHSGDSDSTGSIAGAITGTIHGPRAFFEALKSQDARLEHDRLLGRLAIDLAKMREFD